MTPPAPRLLLAVAVGGSLGALLRYTVAEVGGDTGPFPWPTFTVNVIGCALLALAAATPWIRGRELAAALVGPGLLGGFTTFSAVSEDTRVLLADGHPALALGYVVGTIAAGWVAFALVEAGGRGDPGDALRRGRPA